MSREKQKLNSASLSSDGSILVVGNRLILTPAEESDKAFILSTWIRSHIKAGARGAGIVEPVFLAEHPRIAESLWRSSFVLKADLGDDRDLTETDYGWICFDYGDKYKTVANVPTLHYVYVVPELRNMGVAKAMVDCLIHKTYKTIFYTHYTSREPGDRFVYNPYRMYGHAGKET